MSNLIPTTPNQKADQIKSWLKNHEFVSFLGNSQFDVSVLKDSYKFSNQPKNPLQIEQDYGVMAKIWPQYQVFKSRKKF